MTNISNSFAKLCRSYVNLADKFQQLDVEYMTLKGKIVPLLKQMKTYQQTIEALKNDNKELQAEITTLSAKYEELRPFEDLLSPEMQTLLEEAQEQINLVDETLSEIDQNNDPDLSEEDKALLEAFRADPDAFALPDLEPMLNDSSHLDYGTNGHQGTSAEVSEPAY